MSESQPGSTPSTEPPKPDPEPSGDAATPRPPLRWWPAAVVVLLGGSGIAFAQLRYADEATWRDAFSMIAVMATVFFLLVWWVFLSRAPRPIRFATGIGTLLAVGGFLTYYEVDELTGSMWIRWRPRFGKSAEDKAVDYFADAATDGVATPSGDAGTDGDGSPTDLIAGPNDWPGFRGPNRDGIASGPMRTDWSARPPRELWRHPIGVGWSSFAVARGLAFTQEQRGPNEMVVCYDVDTGEQIWAHGNETRFEDTQGGDGPRATPTLHGGRLYSLGATGILNCLDPLTGNVHWKRDTLVDAGTGNLIWGQCGSPLVTDELVIVNPGVNAGEGKHGVIAYDRIDGSIRWTAGDDQASYAAPRLETLGGVPQVLVFDAAGLTGHARDDGTELWHFPWRTFSDINVAQPIRIDGETVFVGSGYSHGSALVRVTRNGDAWNAKAVYSTTRGLRLKFQSAVRKGEFVYGLDDGILACHRIDDGTRVWKERDGEYGYGQLLLVGEHIVVTVEKTGEVALVRASPDGFDEIARFRALGTTGTRGILWNHPVLWQGRLLVRNAKEVACFDLRP